MTDPKVNIPLLRKAVEWAEAEAAKPAELCEWVQARYVLPREVDETVRFDFPTQDSIDQERLAFGKSKDCGTCYCVAGYIASLSDQAWTYTTASLVAESELGLAEGSAYQLFRAGNTIEDVRRIAESLAGERL